MASNMSRGDQIKIIAAIFALAVGGVLIAWNFGAFDSFASKPPNPNTKLTAEEKKEAERQHKQAKDNEAIAPPSGS